MHHLALLYRLQDEWLRRDLGLLCGVYEELAARQPCWLTCESFEFADDLCLRLFLLDGDLERSRAQLRLLHTYWASLPERCAGDPQVATMTRADVDRMPTTRVAFWNPYRRSWVLPGSRPSVGSGRRRPR